VRKPNLAKTLPSPTGPNPAPVQPRQAEPDTFYFGQIMAILRVLCGKPFHLAAGREAGVTHFTAAACQSGDFYLPFSGIIGDHHVNSVGIGIGV
jgi:hypothetical protein